MISHNLADVFAVADRIVVLFLGRNAGDYVRTETTREEVVGAITSGPGTPAGVGGGIDDAPAVTREHCRAPERTADARPAAPG